LKGMPACTRRRRLRNTAMTDTRHNRPIALGSDHAGFRYKQQILKLLDQMKLPYHDFGAASEQSVDYPEFARAVAEAVASGQFSFGILVCGSGVGMSVVANKVPGVRAAHCGDTYTARVSREHNDANVLALSERVIGEQVALDIVKTWLSTPFSGEERHVRRLRQLEEIEEEYLKSSASPEAIIRNEDQAPGGAG
jgi:ribose 5-phosphate isomerase B